MRNKKAFTLIELLVVVLIIGILAAIALPQYQWAVEKSHAAEAFQLLATFKEQQEIYYMANNTYASSFEDLGMEEPVSRYFTYKLGSYGVLANDKRNHYVLIYRYDYGELYAGNGLVCGYSVPLGMEADVAKTYCKHLGADTSATEAKSTNTWLFK